MRRCFRGERGLTLLETMIAITIFSIMTVGMVPLLGSAIKGGAASRTESVARNVAGKTMERLRGLRYHAPVGTPARKVDLLDHFFPDRTPLAPSTGTGFVAAANAYQTTCKDGVTLAACNALPSTLANSQARPSDVEYAIVVTATFKDAENPATTVPVPATYAWNSPGNDTPPSKLLQVVVQTTWTVGAKSHTFSLTSYLTDRKRAPLQDAPTPAPAEPTPASGAAPNVKLRAEAKLDYATQVTTTWQDLSIPSRRTEIVATLGSGVAYGEQLDSGSKADLVINSTRLSAVRAADAAAGDAGYEQVINGATYEAHAPNDASSLGTGTGTAQNLMTDVTQGLQAAWTGPAQAGTMSGLGGIGPKVANGLPTVKGYYDFNSTQPWGPTTTSQPVSMFVQPQVPTSGSPGNGSLNPLNLATTPSTTGTPRPFLVRDADSPAGADPRGEVEVHSTAAPGVNQTVRATANVVHGGVIMVTPTATTANVNRGAIEFQNFSASVTCESRPDPSVSSTASGTWSATLRYHSDLTNGSGASYQIRTATLPVQTISGDAQIPVGVDVFSYLKSLNGGNGPLIHDNNNNSFDVWMFAANGKTGLLKDWSTSGVQTSISADDRVAEASLNGVIRLETSPLHGPWGASQRPESDMTVSLGKLGCKTEDYR
jgi:prepilin-type N-terminal cleavage/methylation domain-containing protein